MVSLDEFDSTLYFLDENEIQYLRLAIKEGHESNLIHGSSRLGPCADGLGGQGGFLNGEGGEESSHRI